MDGVRPIHMYNHFTQGVIRTIESQTNRGEIRYNSFGAEKGKRREEAIAIQDINNESFTNNKINHVIEFHDVKNAFPALTHKAAFKHMLSHCR